jgi:hypothetical protein
MVSVKTAIAVKRRPEMTKARRDVGLDVLVERLS